MLERSRLGRLAGPPTITAGVVIRWPSDVGASNEKFRGQTATVLRVTEHSSEAECDGTVTLDTVPQRVLQGTDRLFLESAEGVSRVYWDVQRCILVAGASNPPETSKDVFVANMHSEQEHFQSRLTALAGGQALSASSSTSSRTVRRQAPSPIAGRRTPKKRRLTQTRIEQTQATNNSTIVEDLAALRQRMLNSKLAKGEKKGQ